MRCSLRFGMQAPGPTADCSRDSGSDRFDRYNFDDVPWRERVARRSLYVEAVKEAERHKWIESQKHGRDLGESALHDWFRVYWPQYCRSKRLEHLEGCQLWEEFAEGDFGQFYSLMLQGDLLLDRILDRIHNGAENLELINWALEWGLPINRFIELLTQIDINRARLEPATTNRR